MKRIVIIEKYAEPRTFDKKDGTKGVSTDVIVSWVEQNVNGGDTKNSIVVSVNKYLNTAIVDGYISSGKPVEILYYAEAREYNGKLFNSIRAFLPKELTSDVDTRPL